MKTEIAKFTGSLEMEQAVERMATTVNDGFTGGRVTRHNLISWAVLYFEKNSFQECVERIRQDHFDQMAYLESVLRQAKQAKKAGANAVEISTILSTATAQSQRPTQRRVKRVDNPELPMT